MTATIEDILRRTGPSRSSRLIELLQRSGGVRADAARKRVSRAREPVQRFKIPLLPKGEAFLYLNEDRGSERFWESLVRDLVTAALYTASPSTACALEAG